MTNDRKFTLLCGLTLACSVGATVGIFLQITKLTVVSAVVGILISVLNWWITHHHLMRSAIRRTRRSEQTRHFMARIDRELFGRR